MLKNAKIRILFWAMAARNWGSRITFHLIPLRITFHIIRVHKVGASPGGREAPTFLHIIRLLGESLSHNFSIVLVCENFVLAENHFSFNSVAGESLSNNFTTVLECKKMFVAPNFFPPLIKAPTLALQAEPKLGPPWGAGRPQVYGV